MGTCDTFSQWDPVDLLGYTTGRPCTCSTDYNDPEYDLEYQEFSEVAP